MDNSQFDEGGKEMSKFLCANINKEEYLDFGVYSENITEGCAACKTLEYFLATEWSKDNVVFFYQDSGYSEIFPEEENAYDFVVQNYCERSVLNSVPKYTYIVNVSNKEYYFKAALPESEDYSYICPLPFILSEQENNCFGDCIDEKEFKELGRWVGGNIVATNNKDFCSGYTLFESPYRMDNELGAVLKGLNIVVTGTISGYTRAGIENYIRQHGGNPQSSVTKKTNLVVKADFKPGNKKLDDAAKYGIKVISEQDFFNMLGE